MAPLKCGPVSLDHHLLRPDLVERVHLDNAVSEVCEPERALESLGPERHRLAINH